MLFYYIPQQNKSKKYFDTAVITAAVAICHLYVIACHIPRGGLKMKLIYITWGNMNMQIQTSDLIEAD